MGSITMASVIAEIKSYGLDAPEVLEVMHFADVGDILKALYPDRSVVLSADAIAYLDRLLLEVSARARLARRLEERGITPSLGDTLWAAGCRRRRADEALALELETAQGSAGVRSSDASCVWRPMKRVKRPTSLGGADSALMKKWGSRLAALLKNGNTPSWQMAQSSSDSAAAMAGLVGKARPATVAKRVRGWETFSRWLSASRGYAWPTGPVDIVDYLAARVAEGCPPSLPESLRSAVLWVEARSGFGPDECFGKHEFVRKNVDRADVVARTGANAVMKAPLGSPSW